VQLGRVQARHENDNKQLLLHLVKRLAEAIASMQKLPFFLSTIM
jgi:hypothetical protein